MIVPPQARPLVTNLLPETVAKYFTRDVVDVELLAEDEAPEIEQRAEELRAHGVRPGFQAGVEPCLRRAGDSNLTEYKKKGNAFGLQARGRSFLMC